MQQIDFMTCDMDDVITRSLIMHPSMLADAMAGASRAHTMAAQTMIDGSARNIAGGMAMDARTVVDLIDSGDLTDPVDAIKARVARLSFGRRIMLFTAAARLQCLTPSLARSIAEREHLLPGVTP